MDRKCLICNSKVSNRNQRVRNGEYFEISFCQTCDFEFFSHNPNEGLEKDKLDLSRLASAGLAIPEVEEDFNNGLIQSKEYIDKYINHEDIGKNILEIGCSWGYFLKLLKDFGCNAYGVEINNFRMSYVNSKLKINCKPDITAYENKKLKFKKIFLFYVLEYIQNPVLYISKLFDLLEPSGELVIITPNLRDVLKEVFNNKAFNDFFYDKYAVNYFSIKSITALSKKLNTQMQETEIITNQGYSFINHTNWHLNNEPKETKKVGGDNFVSNVVETIKNYDSELSTRLIEFYNRSNGEYNKIIADAGLGNQIIIKFKK